MFIIIISFTILFLFINALLLWAFYKNSKLEYSDEIKKISVVIAAKNEEKNLGRLFHSINNLNYPADKFEIIFIDDNSTDRTYEMLYDYSNKFENILVLKAIDKKYPLKKGALDFGIRKAAFEFVVTTDADCSFNSDWLKSFSDHFNKFDVVIGSVKIEQTLNPVSKISSFENLRNRFLVWSLSGFGIHYTSSGGNFGYKKSLYFQVGGFDNITSTASGDDDLLLQKFTDLNANICVAKNIESFVQTAAPIKLLDLFKQKARHTSSSFKYKLKFKFMLTFWHLLNIIFLFSFLPTPYFKIFLLPFAVKLVVDALTVTLIKNKFNYKFSFAEVFILQPIYELLLIVNFTTSIFNRSKW